MNLRSFATIALGLTLTAGSTAAIAAPSITVTRTTQTASTVTIKVEGKGFTKSRVHQLEINQGGAFSGNLPQILEVSANSSGTFNVTRTVASSCACRIGVWGTDRVTWFDSNAVNLNVPAPCKKPSITVARHNNERDATITKGVNFTPNSSSTIEEIDLTTGEFFSTSGLPTFGTGTTGAHRHWGDARCGHVIRFTMIDESTDTISNSVDFRLCSP